MKFRIMLKSFDDKLINEASKELRTILLDTDCQLKGVVSLPVKIKKFCVLRSPHIDKDSREHFEVRIHKRFMDLEANSPAVFDSLLRVELPAGINCSLKILENI